MPPLLFTSFYDLHSRFSYQHVQQKASEFRIIDSPSLEILCIQMAA
jgi:hypothetical protein